MATGSGSGRRILTTGAVLCAVCGLVLAASAMPMVASESPANGLLDGIGGGEATTQQSAQAQGGGTGGLSGDAGTQGAGTGESELGGALADRAAAIDNPVFQGALYGLASLLSLFAGDPSPLDSADGGAERTADPAAAGVDGAFGERLESPGDATNPDVDEMEAPEDETTGATDSENASGVGTGPGESSSDDRVVENGSGATGGGSETDGAGTGDESETDGEVESGDGSSEAGDPDSADGTADGTTETDDGHASGSDGDATEPAGSTSDPGDGTETESTATDGTDGSSEGDNGDGDGTSAEGEDGDDESALEDSLPGASDGVLTPLLGVLAVAALGYVAYTRDDPIGTLRVLPGRVVSLAVAGVVACSQALERAIGRLRGLQSIAELPGLVAATLAAVLGSARARLRDAVASLPPFGDESAADAEPAAEAQVAARERIRRAFASVIDAAPMYRGSAATATPAEVARRASDAGAPREPVETITDSFRDVEYGDRDPESHLERTTAAHDRLRSALEVDVDADAADGSAGATAEPAATDSGTTAAEPASTGADADE